MRTFFAITAVFLVTTVSAFGQVSSGGPFSLDRTVIAGGGGTSSDAASGLSVSGTIGQPMTDTSSGGAFGLSAGFWVPVATSSDVSVTGRILQADGRGIRNATLYLSGGPLPTPLRIVSVRYGNFRFDNVASGYTYTITVQARRFTFSQPSQTVAVTASGVSGLVFTATP
jgi:hypothetical protein